jgi:hypothetical protein
MLFKKPGVAYPEVPVLPELLSFSCGRVVPDALVPDSVRDNFGEQGPHPSMTLFARPSVVMLLLGPGL